jgi:hypothetical protein
MASQDRNSWIVQVPKSLSSNKWRCLPETLPLFRKCDRGEVFWFVLEPQVAFFSLSLTIALNGQCKLYGIRFQNNHTARAVFVGGQIMPSLKKKNKQKKKKHDAKVGK